MRTLIKAAATLGFAFVAVSSASAQTFQGGYSATQRAYYPAAEQSHYVSTRGYDERQAYVPDWQARNEWRLRQERELRREEWRRQQEWRREHSQREQWRREHMERGHW